jgi:uncharacterized LabA/DUF88 family protein
MRHGRVLEYVNYFTADVRGNPAKHRRQQVFLDALDTHCQKLTIVKGHYLLKKRQCRNCGDQFTLSEEKETDVNIATQLVADAYEDRFDVAMVISGDSDLVPPIKLVRNRFPDKGIIVAFPPKRQAQKLKDVASSYFVINETVLRISQLPNLVIKKGGIELKKPTDWS